MSAQASEVSERIADMELIGQSLVKFNSVNAGLAKLAEDYDGVVFDVATTKGMTDAKAARAAIRGPRLEVERLRKEAKAPLIDAGRRLDAEAARITGALEQLEQPIDSQIKNEEARKERERKAREEAELIRVSEIQAAIDLIRDFPQGAMGKSAADVQEAISHLEGTAIDGFYAEFQDRARVAHFTSLAALKNIHAERVAFEAEQIRIQAEREELRQLRLAETQRQEAALREQKIEDDRRQAERDAAIAAERKRLADEDKRLQAERAALEAAKPAPAVTPPPPAVPPAIAPAMPPSPPTWPPTDKQLVALLVATYGCTKNQASRRLSGFGKE